MKIGEVKCCCENCSLTDYCTRTQISVGLCSVGPLMNIDEETYIQMAKKITENEIQSKLKEYESKRTYWVLENEGAICDLIVKKIDTNITMDYDDIFEMVKIYLVENYFPDPDTEIIREIVDILIDENVDTLDDLVNKMYDVTRNMLD